MKRGSISVRPRPFAAPDIWQLGKNDFERLAVVVSLAATAKKHEDFRNPTKGVFS